MNNPTTRIHDRRAAFGLALLLAGTSLTLAQTADLSINTFGSATEGNIGSEWGPGSITWDSGNGNPAGAALVTAVFRGDSDTPLVTWSCLGQYANPWYVQTPINMSQYKSIQFDIKWDNTSDLTVGQFNDLSTWPADLTNSAGQAVFQSWANASTLVGGGFLPGLPVELCGGPAGQLGPSIASSNVPVAAATGWAHMTIPINPAQAQIDGVSGIVLHKWCGQTWALQNPATARFWIDNVMLEGTAAPPPPPTVSLSPAEAGLNLIHGTGNGGDRQNMRTVATTTGANYSWVGRGSTPVSYSFTISHQPGPSNANFMVNSYLLPVPYDRTYATNGTVGTESAADWNYPTCIFMDLEQYDDGSMDWKFRYKTNSPPPNGNGTYYSDVLAELRDYAGGVGTWTLTFVNDTNVTMTSPTGLSTNFVFSADKVSWFADNGGVALPLYHYVGCRGNGAAPGASAVLSRVKIEGTVDTLDDNFLTDTTLNTNLWELTAAYGPSIQVIPAATNPVYWLNWTLPANGYVAEKSPGLTGPWTEIATAPLSLSGSRKVLVTASDLPTDNQGYFRVVKRYFSKLQVLMPGESPAPGTLTGKTGTPTAQVAGVPFDVTVRAVDANWNLVAGATDTVGFTSDDTTAFLPSNTALNNGTLTATMFFGSAGSWTVTATDVTDGTKTPNTGSATTVNP